MTNKEKIAYSETQNAYLSQELQSFEHRAILAESEVLSQKVVIQGLELKVQTLSDLLEKAGILKDSHNSSKPPSTDLFPVKKSLRKASDLKSGGQLGHKGTTLKMSATPDKIIELQSDFCSACGTSLQGSFQELQSKRQVVELPPIAPIYEEYRQFSCTCPQCANVQIASYPAGVNSPIQYGSSVVALTSYWSVYQYIPYQRMSQLFNQIFQLKISEGSISNMLTKASQKCKVVYEAIKKEVSLSKVVGSDETGAKVNGNKWWIWVWQTVLNTFLVINESRGAKATNEVWEQGLENVVLVSDRWATQLKMKTRSNQLCLAHLLRDLTYLVEKEAQLFASDLKGLFIEVFTLKKAQMQNGVAWQTDNPQARTMELRLNNLLAQVIDKVLYPKTYTFQQSMLKYSNCLLNCLYNLDIPPDNNASERAIRNVKVKQKISGQFKTGQTAFCVIRSVIDTLKKRKLDVLTHLRLICALNPEQTKDDNNPLYNLNTI